MNKAINIPLPDKLKADFMAKCKSNGTSQKWVITKLIGDWTYPQSTPAPKNA